MMKILSSAHCTQSNRKNDDDRSELYHMLHDYMATCIYIIAIKMKKSTTTKINRKAIITCTSYICVVYKYTIICRRMNSGWILYALIWTFTWIYVCVHHVLIVYMLFSAALSALHFGLKSADENWNSDYSANSFIINSNSPTMVASMLCWSIFSLSYSFALAFSTLTASKFMVFWKQK